MTSARSLIAAVGITLVSLTDTIALATSFNARRGEQVKPNQEMIGIGSANIAAGFFRGFAISASSSRTAVAEQSGAKSQFAGVVGAGVVVLLLVWFNGLLADLPERGARRRGHRRGAVARRRLAAAPGVAGATVRRASCRSSASVGVIFLGVLEGIVVAIVLSILLFFHRNWWPHGEVLGRVPRSRRLAQRSGRAATSSSIAGVVVFRWEAPLFFANAGIFADQVRELVAERQPGLGRAAVRGDHRHRRHRGRHARAARRRAQRQGRAPRVRRAAHAGCATSSATTACWPRSTATTSTDRSTRHSTPSTWSSATTGPSCDSQHVGRAGSLTGCSERGTT